MRKTGIKKLLPLLLCTLPMASVQALTLEVQMELPQMKVAEYHAPYVAMWLQGQDKRQLTNLALWYDHEMKNDEGQQWLKDIRQWWRRSGRSLSLPVDGITGATRTAGHHTLQFDDKQFAFSSLPAGEYQFFIEAVREVGGRELLSIPVTLPFEKAQTFKASGNNELGQVQLVVMP
ncbi:DUF2271 domain-containing protein [Alteromonadaceae bacterium BrNp21-10]|nr:DUF2271 domain-containing protein [Alteromonadaceae bacterium BrNp21-10]